MNNFCVNLTIDDVLFLDPTYIYKLKRQRHTRVDINMINPGILSTLSSLGLGIVLCESFFRPPYEFVGDNVHKDVTDIDDATKINWVFGGNDSSMNWYAPIKGTVNTAITAIGVEYFYYNRGDLEKLHSQRVGCPSIVQIGIPHDITMGSEHRHCVSMLLHYLDSNHYVKFKDAKNIFSNYIGTP